MSKAYLANLDSRMSEAYVVTCNFISIEVLSVFEVYFAYFDLCICNPYLLMFKANLEISPILLPSFQSGLRTNLHYILTLTLYSCRLFSLASMSRASIEASLKCIQCIYLLV